MLPFLSGAVRGSRPLTTRRHLRSHRRSVFSPAEVVANMGVEGRLPSPLRRRLNPEQPLKAVSCRV